MKVKKLLTNAVYLLIISYFIFDSYFKLTQLPREADLLRSKYSSLQDLLNRAFGFKMPLTTD